MSGRKRLSIYVHNQTHDRLRIIAEKRAMNPNDTLRLALGILEAIDQAQDDGLTVGAARDKSVLDQTFVLPA